MVVKANTLLVNVLRDQLGLTGTKRGCELGDCGSCTVLLDGSRSIHAWSSPWKRTAARSSPWKEWRENSQLDAVQQAFSDHAAVQCGFCIPGMVLSAKALLTRNPHPTEREVREAIAGNLCRCTGYVNIVKAVLSAAEGRKGGTT